MPPVNQPSIAVATLPLVVYGVTFPATAHIAHAYSYDANGRLVADHGTFSDGVAFWDETVHYDDAALRRDRVFFRQEQMGEASLHAAFAVRGNLLVGMRW
jgi:hypothetical protein